LLRYTYIGCLVVLGGGGGGSSARVMFKPFTDFIFEKEKENKKSATVESLLN
jgi:hypothetical protein